MNELVKAIQKNVITALTPNSIEIRKKPSESVQRNPGHDQGIHSKTIKEFIQKQIWTGVESPFTRYEICRFHIQLDRKFNIKYDMEFW